MLKNYIKIAYRNIIKQKSYSFINIFGLALGLTACIFVGLYIWQECNYDNYHVQGDNLYRLGVRYPSPNGASQNAESPALVAPTLGSNIPEIEKISRIYFSSDDLITNGEKKFYEDGVIFADPDFFDMFSYTLLQGSETNLLKNKNTIVITDEMAQKYFGKENPIGKILNYNNKVDFEVVGVIGEVPANSHFTFDIAATYESLEDLPPGNYLEQWGATFGSYTYVLLHPETDPGTFKQKADDFLAQQIPHTSGVVLEVILRPIKSIHLYSHIGDEIRPNNSISYIIILGSISLFILILACINFVNLTTARAVKRAREIGVRKVFGAIKHQLVRQFLCESVIITFFALICACVMVEILKPFFSQLIGTELLYDTFDNLSIFIIILGSTLIIGILAGLYPSFVLTHYKPAQVIKGSKAVTLGKKGSALLRKGLVILQFSISIILIIFTIVINRQVNFMRTFDMGFEKDHIIVLRTPERMSSKYQTIKNEMSAVPGVTGVAASLGAPVFSRGFGTNLTPNMQHEEDEFRVSVKMADHDFLDLYDMELLAGIRLSDLEGANFRHVAIVNETVVKKLGFTHPEDALGHAYTIGLSDGVERFKPEIIGVVKDFNFDSLHEEISPLLFMYLPYLFQEISIRISPLHIHETIDGIKNVWEKFYSEHPFTYNFLDERIEQLYKAEERSFKVITTFSILAIFIACLGLLGLTFYTTEQRRKEIGIRKVLGASVASIINNISMEFLKLVLVANIIAWPISYFAINKWLANFPYKVDLQITFFLAGGLMALAISCLTILYIVMKSATSNPIESIRYE